MADIKFIPLTGKWTVCHHLKTSHNLYKYPTCTYQARSYKIVPKLFPNCFQDLGKVQGEPYHTKVGPNTPSKMNPCRPVQVHQQTAFKQQLAEMQAAGIMKPVNLATAMDQQIHYS